MKNKITNITRMGLLQAKSRCGPPGEVPGTAKSAEDTHDRQLQWPIVGQEIIGRNSTMI